MCKVKTHLNSNDWFEVMIRVKQGRVFSSVLFIILMDFCGELVQRGIEGVIFGYAYDIASVTEAKRVLQDSLQGLKC